jgi:hypothetical protein
MSSFIHLRNRITVKASDRDVHVVPLRIEAGHVDGLRRHGHKDGHLVILDLLPDQLFFT